MESMQLGFIGTGNMATAIIQGILRVNKCKAKDITVFDINPEKCQVLASCEVNVASSISQLVKQCNIIFLCVKPQNFTDVLGEIKLHVTPDKVFVSIAAGVSTRFIQDSLDCPCPVIRAMPNTPLLLGKGATALCHTNNVKDTDFSLVESFFSSCGIVCVLEEEKMNAIISVNGSSPAYIYLFAKAIVEGAMKQGIPKQIAFELICQTLEGSAAMLRQSGASPDELIHMVSSPGGTTLKALEKLEEGNFVSLIEDAMTACTKRAEELGK